MQYNDSGYLDGGRTMAVVLRIVKGNPGALSASSALATLVEAKSDVGRLYFENLAERILESGIIGSDLWVKYKNDCGEDREKFLEWVESLPVSSREERGGVI